MDAHGPTGRSDIAQLSRHREGSQTKAVQQVILRHGDASWFLDLVVRTKDASPFSDSGGCAPVSLQLGDRTA
jgi:hypothetical protein